MLRQPLNVSVELTDVRWTMKFLQILFIPGKEHLVLRVVFLCFYHTLILPHDHLVLAH